MQSLMVRTWEPTMNSKSTPEHIAAFGSAIASYLSGHRHELERFEWAISKECVDKAAELDLVHDLSMKGDFAETSRLRKAVARRAGEIQTRVQGAQRFGQLAELADFVISYWGGVNSNDRATLVKYAQRFNDIETPFAQVHSAAQLRALMPARSGYSFTGIASWSKWLNFVWNDWALIYDARIAFALDAIHFLHCVDAPVFPVPPGRNSQLAALDAESSAAFRWLSAHGDTGAIAPKAKINVLPGSAVIAKEHAYGYYLAVMQAAHALLWPADEQHPLVHTEMLLFCLSIDVIASDFAREMLDRLKPRAGRVG
jgi:hypothetical protein